MPVRDEKPEKLRVDHVERGPLPWRDVELTECGLPVEAHPVITRNTYQARLREWGQQRTGFTVCRTCSNTGSLTHCAGPGIQHASQGSQDATDPLVPQRELQFIDFYAIIVNACPVSSKKVCKGRKKDVNCTRNLLLLL